jgi:hypothetical protein
LPPACSAKDLPGRRTHKINIGRVRWINCLPVISDGDSVLENVSDTKNSLN